MSRAVAPCSTMIVPAHGPAGTVIVAVMSSSASAAGIVQWFPAVKATVQVFGLGAVLIVASFSVESQ